MSVPIKMPTFSAPPISSGYWDRPEKHHVWGNHCGPTIDVSRIEHTLIHQDVANALKSIGEPTARGFCGDPFTNKFINPICDSDGNRF